VNVIKIVWTTPLINILLIYIVLMLKQAALVFQSLLVQACHLSVNN